MQPQTQTERQLHFFYKKFGVLNATIINGCLGTLLFRSLAMFPFFLVVTKPPRIPSWYLSYVLGVFLISVIFGVYLKRTRRYRDLLLFNLFELGLITVEMVGIPLIYLIARYHMWWLAEVVIGITLWKVSRLKYHARAWEEIWQRRLLRKFIDEEQWRVRYQPLEFSRILAQVKRDRQRRWATRLEKLSPLVPGASIFLRRTFGHTPEMMATLELTLGMILLWAWLENFIGYRKVKEWDNNRGRALIIEN